MNFSVLENITTNKVLRYRPEWYYIGDPNIPGMVLAYGVISLCTVWLAEGIAEHLLFRGRNTISLSNLAAVVTFRSSTWFEIGKWIIHRPQQCRFSTQAVWGTLFRIIVTFVEIGIVVASIPRGIPVFESQVGSTEISFRNGSWPLSASVPTIIPLPCSPELFPYDSFSPTITRQVCLNIGVINDVETADILKHAPDAFDVYRLQKISKTQELEIASGKSGIVFSISHIMLVDNENDTSLSPYRLVYPLPDNIVRETSEFILSYQNLNGSCTNVSSIQDKAVFFACSNLTVLPSLPSIFPQAIYGMVGTRSIKFKKKLLMEHNTTKFVDVQVGVASRPRICIIPAISICVLLFLLSFLLGLRRTNSNITLQLLHWCSQSTDEQNSSNPMCKVY